MEQTTNDSSADSGQSLLTDGLGAVPCKHCGSERYVIKMLYTGHRNNVAVVECGECRGDATPVVLDYFMPEAECYTKCREAWNVANKTPNAIYRDKTCSITSQDQPSKQPLPHARRA